MQKILRQALIEIIWLTVSFGLTLSVFVFVSGGNPLGNTNDIHLHDTYIIVAPFHSFLPFFLLVTFIIYFIKELRNSFQRMLPNWMVIITGQTLLIILTFLTQRFTQLFPSEWTLYPPLSSLGPDRIPELKENPAAKLITCIFAFVQIIVSAMLLYVTFRWGRKKQIKTN